MLQQAFSPYEKTIAAVLQTLNVARQAGRDDKSEGDGGDDSDDSDDGAHDRSHLIRVWTLVKDIATNETAVDLEMLAVATLLHDCVPVEKTDPRRAQASRLSADKASGILQALGWPDARVRAAAHVIEAHSFSAGIPPRSLEACILRDADRLDAIGAIGIARTFYVAGRMGSRLYDHADPFAERRALDDRRFSLDHFETKLFRLVDGLTTPAGKAIGERRVATMRAFLEVLRAEISMSS